MNSIKAFFVVMLCASVISAQTITVATQDGKTTEVSYQNGTLKKRVVVLDSGERLEYTRIESISTDDFDAYEEAVARTSRQDYQHVTVRFTGKEDVNTLRLQKLEKKRRGAGTAQGAGGFLMLLGVLSGSRQIAAAGVGTYGIATVVKDANTDKTIAAQNQAIRDLQAQQKKLSEADSLEEQFRIAYGDENVDGLIALIDNNHQRALAFATAGETSEDANYRLSAVWLKTIIYADQGDREAVEKEYDRLIVLDPEVSSVEDADRWMELLLEDLEEMRQG